MTRCRLTRVCGPVLAALVPAALMAPTGVAEPIGGTVTYEVASDAAVVANVQYQDRGGRIVVGDVALPWRIEATVDDVFGPPPRGSQIRADWRAHARPGLWVMVRIIHQGKLICQSTMDVGNSTCYGVTPRIT